MGSKSVLFPDIKDQANLHTYQIHDVLSDGCSRHHPFLADHI